MRVQVMSLVAMERPVSRSAEHIRDEKVSGWVVHYYRWLVVSEWVISDWFGDREA